MFWKARLHTTLDTLSIGAMYDCMDSNNYDKLVISGNPSKKKLKEVWKKLYDDYLKLFGIPEQFKRYVKLKGRAARLWSDVYLKGQKWKTVLARVADFEADQAIKQVSDSGTTIDEVLIGMAQMLELRYPLEKYKVTVTQFHGYKQLIEKRTKKV